VASEARPDDVLAPWDDPAKVPESWQPSTTTTSPTAPIYEPTSMPDRIGDKLPLCDTENPADLEAFYGPGGFVEPLRKIVLSNCREIERAKAIAENQKTTESRLDDLAHVNSAYVDFIIAHLEGRRLREENVIQSLRRGA
jgi:hypothetical protein